MSADPRPAIGDIMVELIRAGCYWQTGRIEQAKRTLKRAAIALDTLRAGLARQRETLPAKERPHA